MSVALYTDELSLFSVNALKAIQPFIARLTELISYVRKTLAGLMKAGFNNTRQTHALQLLMIGAPGVAYLGLNRARRSTAARGLVRPASSMSDSIQLPIGSGIDADSGYADEGRESLPHIGTPIPEGVQQQIENSIQKSHDQNFALNQYTSEISNTHDFISRSFGDTRPTGISNALKQSLGETSSSFPPQLNLTKQLSTGPLVKLYTLGSKFANQSRDNYHLQPVSFDTILAKEIIGVSGIIERTRQSANVPDISNTLLQAVGGNERAVNSGIEDMISGSLPLSTFDRISEGAFLTRTLISDHSFEVAQSLLTLLPNSITRLKSSASLVNKVIAKLQDRNLSNQLGNLLNATISGRHSQEPLSDFVGQLSTFPFMWDAISIPQSIPQISKYLPSNLNTLSLSLPDFSIASKLGLDTTSSINPMTKLGSNILSQLQFFSNQVMSFSPKDLVLGLGLRLGLGLGQGPEPLNMLGGTTIPSAYSVLNMASNVARKVDMKTAFGFRNNLDHLLSLDSTIIPYSPHYYPNFSPFLHMTKLPIAAGFSNFMEDAVENIMERTQSYTDIQGSLGNQFGINRSSVLQPALQPLFQPILQSSSSLIPRLPSSSVLQQALQPIFQSSSLIPRLPSSSVLQQALQPIFQSSSSLIPRLSASSVLQQALQPIFQSSSLIPRLPSSSVLQPAIMGIPIAARISNFMNDAVENIVDRTHSHTEFQGSLVNQFAPQSIQDQLALPDGFKKLGSAAGSKFEDSLSKLSPISKNEFLTQLIPRRRVSTRQYVQTVPRSQRESQLPYLSIDNNPKLLHRKSEFDVGFRTDTGFAPDFSNTKDFGMENPFDGDLVKHDGSGFLEDKDSVGLKKKLEGNIERVLSRELLKYGVDYPNPGVSERLSPLANNMPENEDEESELRLLKRRLEQILGDQLRKYYGFQI